MAPDDQVGAIKAAGANAPAPDLGNYKWKVLGLLFFAYFFYYGDRAIFGVVNSAIVKDLKLSDAHLGLIQSVMFFALALCMPLAGYITDRFNRKWIITLSLIFWSIATACTGAAEPIGRFFTSRLVHVAWLTPALLGMIIVRSLATAGSESFYGPASTSLLASFHRETRALALSIHQASLYIGVMASGFLGGWIAERWGWRWTFYIYGFLGILLGFVFIVQLREAPREPAPPGAAAPRVSPLQALIVLFRVPTALFMLTGFSAIVFVNNAYVTWAPRLLQDKFGLSMTAAGHDSMFYHHITALFAVLAGGYLSDRLVRRFPNARLIMMTCAMFGGGAMIVTMGLAPSVPGVCLAMALFGLCRGFYECNTHASLFEVIEPRYRGSAVAVMIMVAMLIGSQSSLILGWCSGKWGAKGLALGFSSYGAFYLLGGLAIATALVWTYPRDRIHEGK